MLVELAEFIDEVGEVHLHKDKEEGEIVSSIETMPPGTHEEGYELGLASRYWHSLVNALSEPLLSQNIPGPDSGRYREGSEVGPDVDQPDAIELVWQGRVVAESRSMDR